MDRNGAVPGWAEVEGWGRVKDREVSRTNDSEISGLEDPH